MFHCIDIVNHCDQCSLVHNSGSEVRLSDHHFSPTRVAVTGVPAPAPAAGGVDVPVDMPTFHPLRDGQEAPLCQSQTSQTERRGRSFTVCKSCTAWTRQGTAISRVLGDLRVGSLSAPC